MGIQANNIVVKGSEKEDKVEDRELGLSSRRTPEVSKTIENIKEPSIVVDGKVKKISKKSAFLLDMLSLDD